MREPRFMTTRQIERMPAYRDGANTRMQNGSMGANPFSRMNHNHHVWRAGYLDIEILLKKESTYGTRQC